MVYLLSCVSRLPVLCKVSEKLLGGRRGYPMHHRQEASGHSCPRLVSTAIAQETSETRGYEVGHRSADIH